MRQPKRLDEGRAYAAAVADQALAPVRAAWAAETERLAWGEYCVERGYPEAVRSAVARAIEAGARWWIASAPGGLLVRVLDAPESTHAALRLAGLRWDGACWAWSP